MDGKLVELLVLTFGAALWFVLCERYIFRRPITAADADTALLLVLYAIFLAIGFWYELSH